MTEFHLRVPGLLSLGAALLLAACGADTLVGEARNEQRVAAESAASVGRVFRNADPLQVVAQAGDQEILVGELATYLELYPSLTTTEALEDLIDIHLAAAQNPPLQDADILDGQTRGRVVAWLAELAWSDGTLNEEGQARVQQMLTSTEYTTVFGVPELAVVSHVLFTADEDEQTPERAAGAQALADRLKSALADLGRPVFGFDLWNAVDELISADDPLLHGMEIYRDPPLIFPREFSGTPRWAGLPSVAPGFDTPAFEAPLNTVIGPAQSMYGWHVMVVEERLPADLPSASEQRAIAERQLLGSQRENRVRARVEQLRETTSTRIYEETVRVLGLSAEERLRYDADAHGAQFR